MVMTGKKTRPMIGKLITSGNRSGVLEVGTSPTTPLEFKILSPRGIVNCDVSGVGLGIVAALEKSGDKKATSRCWNPVRSDPIPVNEARKVGLVKVDQESENERVRLEEGYTIVIRRMPKKSYTEVYHGGVVYDAIKIGSKSREGCVFDISPARFGEDAKGYPAPDFLKSCHLCKKKLHGLDIYMYRGEKAFCSTECRCREMVMDERREKHCSSEAVSSSPCSHGQMMSTGIFAI